MLQIYRLEHTEYTHGAIQGIFASLIGELEEIKSTIDHYKKTLPKMEFENKFLRTSGVIQLPSGSLVYPKKVDLDSIRIQLGDNSETEIKRLLSKREGGKRGMLYKLYFSTEDKEELEELKQNDPRLFFLSERVLGGLQDILK